MDLVRSWVAAAVAWVVGMWITSVIGYAGVAHDAYVNFLGRLLWLYVPLLVVYVLIAGVASAVHTRPRRRQRVRHLVAVLPVPVVTIVLSTVMGAIGPTETSGLVLSVAFSALGTVVGWLLADLAWSRVTEDRSAYF